MTIKVGDTLPDGTLTEFFDTETEACAVGPNAFQVADLVKGKKIALFGSYGWGDGEWMRTWQSEVEADGISLVAEGLIVNETPDAEGEAACKELGKKLA